MINEELRNVIKEEINKIKIDKSLNKTERDFLIENLTKYEDILDDPEKLKTDLKNKINEEIKKELPKLNQQVLLNDNISPKYLDYLIDLNKSIIDENYEIKEINTTYEIPKNEEDNNINLAMFKYLTHYVPSWLVPVIGENINKEDVTMNNLMPEIYKLLNPFSSFLGSDMGNLINSLKAITRIYAGALKLLSPDDSGTISRIANLAIQSITVLIIGLSIPMIRSNSGVAWKNLAFVLLQAPKKLLTRFVSDVSYKQDVLGDKNMYAFSKGKTNIKNINYKEKTFNEEKEPTKILAKNYYENFKTWGMIKFYYQNMDNEQRLENLNKKLLNHQIPIQFGPKIEGFQKTNNYAPIGGTGRANSIFLYGGGNNFTRNITLDYMAHNPGFDMSNNVELISSVKKLNKAKVSGNWESLAKNFKEETIKQVFESSEKENWKNKNIYGYSLVDIYAIMFKTMYLMHPYIDYDNTETNEYQHPPLIRIKVFNERDIMFKNFKSNNEKIQEKWYVLNNIGYDLVENSYDISLGISHHIRLTLDLTEVEEDFVKLQYNLKYLIGQ